uniref:Uncharacterized protein n=1 Tax=uncultured marine virus TaxID=186617 RepID=A0A0F7L5Z8_9VIRU|nr:hypothetical protein [uncultured marine virus]
MYLISICCNVGLLHRLPVNHLNDMLLIRRIVHISVPELIKLFRVFSKLSLYTRNKTNRTFWSTVFIAIPLIPAFELSSFSSSFYHFISSFFFHIH